MGHDISSLIRRRRSSSLQSISEGCLEEVANTDDASSARSMQLFPKNHDDFNESPESETQERKIENNNFKQIICHETRPQKLSPREDVLLENETQLDDENLGDESNLDFSYNLMEELSLLCHVLLDNEIQIIDDEDLGDKSNPDLCYNLMEELSLLCQPLLYSVVLYILMHLHVQ